MKIPTWYDSRPDGETAIHIPELADIEGHLLSLGFKLESAQGPQMWGKYKGCVFYLILAEINRPECYDVIRTWVYAYTNGKFAWDIQIPTTNRAINLYCRGLDGDAYRDDLCDDNLDGYRAALGKVMREYKIFKNVDMRPAVKPTERPKPIKAQEQLSLF